MKVRRTNGNVIGAVWSVALTVAAAQMAVAADAYSLEEPDTDSRPRMTTIQVAIDGDVVTSSGGGKTLRHDLDASAAYRFTERRLSGAGQDARQFRAVRAFTQAAVRTKISDRLSESSLHPTLRIIAVNGRREGLVRYALNGLLTRDSLDLIDVPGDPLAIVALLPDREVEIGEQWKPAGWAIQMLTAVEAVEESAMTCTLASVEDGLAHVTVSGRVAGVRLGAPSNIDLEGDFEYDIDEKLITTIRLNQTEKAAIGTVTPGIDSQVQVKIERALTESDSGLTDLVLESIPLEPPAERMPLILNAAPWRFRLVHGRNWHVFHASYENTPKVVILRLLEQGSFLCQCNFSPVPSAEPGKHTPLADYEASIQQALGAQFEEFSERGRVPTEDGRKIFRVTALGNYQLPEGDQTKIVPMSWTYYLVAAPSGRQVSFVFAVEPKMREALANRDARLVESLLFDDSARR